MTDPTPDRPLITFALFAYNQEQYIREAVEGAFSQTYDPLEIILSDDCSSDQTYAIMKEMAAAYDGPHEVHAVQTERNMGVSSHVFLRGKEAKGQIVVIAAGDDISKPDRCKEHVGVYRDQTVMGVSGAFDLIDASGKLLSANCKQPLASSAYERQRGQFLKVDSPYVVIQGSTASYRGDVFQFDLPNWQLEFSEDNLFNFIIYAHGFRVAYRGRVVVSEHNNLTVQYASWGRTHRVALRGSMAAGYRLAQARPCMAVSALSCRAGSARIGFLVGCASWRRAIPTPGSRS